MSDDEDIEAELKRGYQFSELAAVFIIAGMITMQSNGCDGLLHRGGRHLFYLSSCVLSIGSAWNEADEHDGWIIETNLRQNKRRTVGSRVFTRN